MRYELNFEAEPFQGHTEFDEFESFDHEAELLDHEAGGGREFAIKPLIRCRPKPKPPPPPPPPPTIPDPCEMYECGEAEISWTPKGHLPVDVTESNGHLVIADFGVYSASVKSETLKEPLLKQWLKRFEDDPSYRLEIWGYGDCVGIEAQNMIQRARRAEAVFQLLGRKARSRVISKKAAPARAALDNDFTVRGRAKNRGVEIIFTQV